MRKRGMISLLEQTLRSCLSGAPCCKEEKNSSGSIGWSCLSSGKGLQCGSRCDVKRLLFINTGLLCKQCLAASRTRAEALTRVKKLQPRQVRSQCIDDWGLAWCGKADPVRP